MKNFIIAACLSLSALPIVGAGETITHHEILCERYGKLTKKNQTCEAVYFHLNETIKEAGLEESLPQIQDAIFFATYKLKGKRLPDSKGTPYIVHPLRVAHHLISVGQVNDPDVLVAAIVRDTGSSEIAKRFGAQVAHYVNDLRRNADLCEGSEQIRLAETYQLLKSHKKQDPSFQQWAQMVCLNASDGPLKESVSNLLK
ncbi:MAG: HD domain-containing protein [Simkaniaceae bacterium]|nr:HD domain-containing protein [Simkaniaceae bacterium]